MNNLQTKVFRKSDIIWLEKGKTPFKISNKEFCTWTKSRFIIPRIIESSDGFIRVRNFYSKDRRPKRVLAVKPTAYLKQEFRTSTVSGCFWPKSEALPIDGNNREFYDKYLKKVYDMAHFWPKHLVSDVRRDTLVYMGKYVIHYGQNDRATALGRFSADSLRRTNPGCQTIVCINDRYCPCGSPARLCPHIELKIKFVSYDEYD